MATPFVYTPQGGIVAAYNVPSQGMRGDQGGIAIAFHRTAQVLVDSAGGAATFNQVANLIVPEAGILALVQGRIANPALRVWTFTLDGHDFFVVRLGDRETILYDAYSQQWIDWDSQSSGAWRPNTGFTWIGGQALANTKGSAIVAGDDTFGLLWFLDPDLAWDESPVAENVVQQIPFDRIVTGQVLASGRAYMPCYAIFVDGDNYGLTATDFVPTVTLETSDDQGQTFDTHDTLNVEPDLSVNNPYAWYSLGQIASPGRMFRVVDNGVFTRIDSMNMNDDG